MYRLRAWSVRNAGWLHKVYGGVEKLIVAMHPLLNRLGYRRIDKAFLSVEKVSKGFLFDSRSCGQCVLGATGLSCPMNCPKQLRNGPCGGVRSDGGCEIQPDMVCVWVRAWEGSQKMGAAGEAILRVQGPIDVRKSGTSAWLRAAREKRGVPDIVLGP